MHRKRGMIAPKYLVLFQTLYQWSLVVLNVFLTLFTYFQLCRFFAEAKIKYKSYIKMSFLR